ncbi:MULTISPECIES: hypothetical protein [Bacillaceae]|uniref:Uncharacterized protein n=2 Tax=Bacillus infantis TaxID=324767 RepID=U5LH15_9BACI|nr:MULTISPECIES: hypothetical protein [Bacillus]OXT17984.1 hypothetical protein B9K06_08950 [Bacillus sp. OG2]AGX06760.1 hypothetical protein N288_24640 [Bacillus infantis NRRL B-14911]EAR67675.1 hypothetical protein B14911_12962 [Bacillus sp. NRRL B-14911]MCK6206617.1 hypothetical protein [Bacillus infantis]MCP1160953.1 hypothetical protein [Bacillus infantis]
MAQKTFNNRSAATLQIALLVRQGENPANFDGDVYFTLAPGQTRTITYGNAQNVFLNGIVLSTNFNGDIYNKTQIVTERGSQLDNLLNTNSIIDILPISTDYVIFGRNA